MSDRLPIDDILPDIVGSLRTCPRLVVQAPPGAGKTTRVPPALLDQELVPQGQVLVLEPRRVAARAVARRIASERGGALGEEVGYQVRFDRVASRETRLMVITEGILTRRLQSDPLLEGVGAVVLDEFHERSIHTDLAIAFLKELQAVRPELLLVVMSATIAAESIAHYLDCPVVESEGRIHPVDVRYLDREPDDVPRAVARAVDDILADPDDDGDILVFLPGARTIHACARALSGVQGDIDVCPLYGALPPEAQDRALTPGPRRKIILATNIAETSLTIEGVTSVIDSGLVKQPVMDEARGFDRLEVRRISLASARQRAGRAGRVRPGRAIRLWPTALEFRMPQFDEPEIRRVDVTAAVLEVVAWSGGSPHAFEWFDAPSDAAIARAVQLLRSLHALEPDGFRITDIGRQLLEMPLHPRLARMLLAGRKAGCGRLMARCAAVLSERDFVTQVDSKAPPARSDVLVRANVLEEVAAGQTRGAEGGGLSVHVGRARTVRDVARQLMKYVEDAEDAAQDADEAVAQSLLVAYPDRIAFRREGARYVMASGSSVVTGHESLVRDEPIIAALQIFGQTRVENVACGIVRMASAVQRAWLEEIFPEKWTREVEVAFDAERERVMASRVVAFDGLEIAREVASVEQEADAGHVARMLAEAAAPVLERAFALSKDDLQFLRRWQCLREWMPELDLPDLSFEQDRTMLEQICWGRRSFAELRKINLPNALRAYLDHERVQALERDAPPRLEVPSGSRIRLEYAPGKPPVLAVRLQEVFGLTQTPTIAGGRVRVLMHLLAPNFRPVQVTEDLESFWENTYPEVRKELRARYPRHPWPENPHTARPVRK